jgi:glutathione synthase/RimK-type ligase-like ATP-grasp enzyme
VRTIALVKDRTGFWEHYGPILEGFGQRVRLIDMWKYSERESALDGGFDALIWRAKHTPTIKRLARRLIYYFNQDMGIPTFPSWRSYWHYDDKIAQHFLFTRRGVAAPRTFVFFDRNEAEEFVRRTEFPIVYKCAHGAGGANVGILTNRAGADRYVRKAFGRGLRTFFKSERQRGYVLLQEFLPGNPGDYRVVCYGDSRACGFFRRNRVEVPLASGSGEFATPDLPADLLDFVGDAQRRLGESVMSYDVLKDRTGAWVVAEVSVIFGDLTHVIYDRAPVYQRDAATGEWSRVEDAGSQHERLVRFLLQRWGFIDG